MLKYQLDSLEGLEEGVAALYEEKDGKFMLKVDGIPQGEDVSGLKTKVDELLAEKKAEAKKRQEAEEAARKAAEEHARSSGDVEALEKSWQEKLSKREQELSEQIAALESDLGNITVGSTADSLAAELALPGSAKALLPHIKQRLKTERRDGKPVTTVLDADGKPSAMSIDDLKAEFANDPAFAPIIVGSKASGGGAGGAKGGGAATSNPFAKGEGFNLTEQARLLKEDPQKAAQLQSQASR